MDINDLIQRFSISRESQTKAVFSTIFIAGNRLQTAFDKDIRDVSLKQFMLLTMVHQGKDHLTFTQLGNLLGCSRQNIKKLAYSLKEKGYVTIITSEKDTRAASICPTEKTNDYFDSMSIHHTKRLSLLFKNYNDEEIQQLFILMMKLYEGIDGLDQTLSNSEC